MLPVTVRILTAIALIAIAGAVAVSLGARSLAHADSGRPAAPRLVILYAPCTVNRNFLGPYNSAVKYTPNLTAFARTGVVFEKQQTEEGLSGIAYASLFSGTQAIQHGVYQHPTRLDDREYLISEAFRDAGYEVFYWAGQDMASAELNYAQGVRPENVHRASYPSGDDPQLERLLVKVRDDPQAKVFVYAAFTVTHMPYSEEHLREFCNAYPAECMGIRGADIRSSITLFRTHGVGWQYQFADTVNDTRLSDAQRETLIRVVERLYKSNIAFLDQLFGGLLDAVDRYGLRDQTVIAFTADHGERMFRSNSQLHWTHGFGLSPESLITPFIVRGPGIRPGRYQAVTRSIDVFPTLAGLAQVAAGTRVTGVDLSTALRGGVAPPELIAFSHTGLLPNVASTQWLPVVGQRFPRNDPSEMWVGGRNGNLMYKLTSPDGKTFSRHVYDWEADRAESRDLYDAADPAQHAMWARLDAYKNELVAGYYRHRSAGTVPALTDGQREHLRALGYIR